MFAMMHLYDPTKSSSFYKDYYEQQVGNGLAVFRGATVQRGHGIGGFFSNLLKGALPMIKSGAKTLGKELLKTGMEISGDLIGGKSFNDSAKERFSNSGQQMVKQISSMLGNGKRKRKAPRQAEVNKRKKLNDRVDIFKKTRKP